MSGLFPLSSYSERDLNPHNRYGHKILSLACLPFHHPSRPGAKDGTRTRDPDLGKVVLYQLSYFRNILIFKDLSIRFSLLPCQGRFHLSFRGKVVLYPQSIAKTFYPAKIEQGSSRASFFATANVKMFIRFTKYFREFFRMQGNFFCCTLC